MSGPAESGAAVSGAAVSATAVSGAAESELSPIVVHHAASSITATTPGLTNLRHVCDFVIVIPPSRAAGCGFVFVVHCPVTASGVGQSAGRGRGRQSGCRREKQCGVPGCGAPWLRVR